MIFQLATYIKWLLYESNWNKYAFMFSISIHFIDYLYISSLISPIFQYYLKGFNVVPSIRIMYTHLCSTSILSQFRVECVCMYELSFFGTVSTAHKPIFAISSCACDTSTRRRPWYFMSLKLQYNRYINHVSWILLWHVL